IEAVRNEIAKLGVWTGVRPAAPRERSQGVPRPLVGQAVLATWPHLLDKGRMQDGEPFLAGTAPISQARISAATAAAVGVQDGGQLTVSTRSGAITAPVVVTDMPDHVVWLPTNSAGSAVRSTLRVDAGDLVSLGRRAEVRR
ncbi:MAG: molybdopterin dinucleotide binding domain-containing protein, partial [Allobranchiibius sp.]